MPRGPLPKPEAQRRRRNAPTVPTTDLPAGGRKGAAPKCPAGYEFGPAAAGWWKWAWATPQAAAWSTGDLYVIARRAQLEDDYRRMTRDAEMEWDDVESLGDFMTFARVLVGAEQNVKREMRELDDRLGLTPKAMAALRWRIVAEEAPPIARARSARRRRDLHVVGA